MIEKYGHRFYRFVLTIKEQGKTFDLVYFIIITKEKMLLDE